MLEEIQELYAFNDWANRRIIEACSPLSEEQLQRDLHGSFPSLLATLAHVLIADWLWLQRWNGTSPKGQPEEWDLSTFELVVGLWRAVEEDRRRYLAGLTEDQLRTELHYQNLRGEAFNMPLWQLLRHVVNHATYHRGQVVTLLRQLGAPAPSTDLVLYYREQRARSAQQN